MADKIEKRIRDALHKPVPERLDERINRLFDSVGVHPRVMPHCVPTPLFTPRTVLRYCTVLILFTSAFLIFFLYTHETNPKTASLVPESTRTIQEETPVSNRPGMIVTQLYAATNQGDTVTLMKRM
jgi:hypothetical protein